MYRFFCYSFQPWISISNPRRGFGWEYTSVSTSPWRPASTSPSTATSSGTFFKGRLVGIWGGGGGSGYGTVRHGTVQYEVPHF